MPNMSPKSKKVYNATSAFSRYKQHKIFTLVTSAHFYQTHENETFCPKCDLLYLSEPSIVNHALAKFKKKTFYSSQALHFCSHNG